MTTYILHSFPADTELARFTVRDTTHLAEKLCKCDRPGLSVPVIEALLWAIERRDVASFGAFTLRRVL